MNHPATPKPRLDRPEILIVLMLLAITAALHKLGVQRPSLLTVYVWPVVLAGYYYGRSRALVTALLASGLVCGFAALVPGAFESADTTYAQKWIDLGIWSLLLVLTAAVVGHLYEVKQQAFGELRAAYNGVLELLSKFIDTADRYTEAHSVRVSLYSEVIARRLGLQAAEIEDVRVAGLLHDVGKLEVSGELLRKVGDLTNEEWTEVRRHPANGAWLLGRVGGMLRNAIPSILYHHERFDGRGYYKLRGAEIPLGARIIAVADSFDAMTTTRSYRVAMPAERAASILEKEAAAHFDPKIVGVFLQALREPGSRVLAIRDGRARFEGISWPDRSLEELIGTNAVAGPRALEQDRTAASR